ncbi:uncharacterized protein LOC127757418 [Oryza glaberrima]|uniref:uncharacterized protein LOC127757418 n=1 Tax=Oryza glaberrima TaxID=4538 RepID=UPI00224C37DF|nr:uncharacterized protein LOC127757418 [Oryza glaberrima]
MVAGEGGDAAMLGGVAVAAGGGRPPCAAPPGSGGGAGVLGVAEDAEVDVDVVRGHGHGVPVRIRVHHRSGGMGSGASAAAAAASMGGRGSRSFSLRWAATNELSGGEARRIERHVTLTPLFFHLSTFCRWGAGVVTGHRRRAGTQGNGGVEEGGIVGAAREVLATTGAVGDEESVGNAGEGHASAADQNLDADGVYVVKLTTRGQA